MFASIIHCVGFSWLTSKLANLHYTQFQHDASHDAGFIMSKQLGCVSANHLRKAFSMHFCYHSFCRQINSSSLTGEKLRGHGVHNTRKEVT